MEKTKFKHLIADTTAFINAVPLNELAEKVYTVPDVVNEVKHKRQIRRLVVLPYDLEVKEPDSSSLSYVTSFAKKTGDFKSLSAIDLKVIALTYELEKQFVGTEHLRQEPVISKVIASKEKPPEFEDKTLLAGFYVPHKHESEEDGEVEGENSVHTNDETYEEKVQGDDQNEIHDTCEDLEANVAKISISPEAADDPSNESQYNTENETQEEVESENDDESDYSENSEDEDAWITPSNISKVKKSYTNGVAEDKPTFVACMSTDYAIQNVLKQINLNIAALDGRIIRNMRTYILRCYACFKTTSVMSKVFCPNCGHKTLKRVAVSLDENGQQVIHINSRRPLTTKFKNQSIPRPKGGKHSRNPILVEDQPIPKQMPSRVAKTKTNALNDDYTAGYSPFVARDVDSKSALLRSKGNIKQWARNNDYEEARRKRTVNRLVK